MTIEQSAVAKAMADKQKQQLVELLKIHYGYQNFRPGQEKVIDSVLSGKDTVVIMPTGGGKSLCYQLPALVLEGITIVVSPLIALMKDQVDSLARVGIPATYINSSISPNETSERLEAIKLGRYKLLYIAPERFYSQDFLAALSVIKVSLFAIDEAHCISSWGHDFRPSYIRLREAIKFLGNPTVLALTATATPEVRDDIIKQLNLEKPNLVVTGFARPNLSFGVIHSNEGQKPQYVIDAINGAAEGSGIIYVGTRGRADQLLQILLDNGIEATCYHAGMDPADRKWVQENFIKNKAKVIIATNAFGLGIDKPDVRFVIHYDMPGTIEAYYQEAGRAGRDGKPSFCLLLSNSRDRVLQEFFIKGDNPPAEMVLELYEILLSYESDRVLVTYSELMKMLGGNAPDMAIGTAIKLLEKDGYIRRSQDKTGNAYLKLLKTKTEIIELIGGRAKTQLEIIEKLIGKYGEQLVEGFEFNLEEAAGILEIKKDSISRLIKKLKDVEAAEYKPPFKGTEIIILKRVARSEVNLDFTALREKMRHAYAKLDKMENYVYHDECRPGYLMGYFGESENDCGKCDNCLNNVDQPSYENLEKTKSKTKVKNTESLGTKLTQIETYELYNQGKNIDEMAQIRNLKPATIVEHLCYLIENKLKIDVNKFVSSEKQQEILGAIEKVGGAKLTPLKEALGDSANWDEIKLMLAEWKIKK